MSIVETDSRIPYNRLNGPEALSRQGFRIEVDGINCQGLVHAFHIDQFAQTLDPRFRSKEIYEDEENFRTVDLREASALGDIYCLGFLDTSPERLHLAVVDGKGDPEGKILVLRHSTNRHRQRLKQGVGDAALSLLVELYGGVRAIKRLRTEPGKDRKLPLIEEFDQ